ncbi:MAG: Hsp20/alpha crystallin family protein [Ekhidna sp.]|nr:Hsp20/alpha crystallin family protein [Ekhidna sp.]MBC6410811.1 Hsp20/alpha crystallin family protein [Ekhidna sp.]MBC6425378.1 Hsp20/alpha crystallin family protein [Ekhidna sp.]
MALIKYNNNDYRPTSFRNFVDRFFNDEFVGGSVPSFSPKVDIAESDKEYEIQLHVPGVKKTDFNINLNDDQLTISGERKFDDEKKEKNFHSVESYFGSFSRTFYLPEIVNREKADAKYENGILVVTLPKDEKRVAKKQIAVK